MSVDASLVLFLNGLTGTPVVDALVRFFATYLPYLLVGACALGLFFAPYARTKKAQAFLAVVATTVVARFGVTETIRVFYHRPRPFLALPEVRALFTDSAWSFPSGHATFFFGLAAAVYFIDKAWGKWLFAAAVLVSLGRIAAGVHYPSDILAGMVVGVVVAYGVTALEKKITASRS